jgi:hydrogenase maturation protease
MFGLSEASKATLVLALGNPLRGDDGVGPAILDVLAGSAHLPAGVDLLDGGTCGLETALLLRDYRRAIIVDAAELGLAPGGWACLPGDDPRLASGDLHHVGTVHAAGLPEALALGDALGSLPAQVTIFGIQPLATDWAQGLSAAVEAAVPAVCQAICDFILAPPVSGDHKETEYDGQNLDYR